MIQGPVAGGGPMAISGPTNAPFAGAAAEPEYDEDIGRNRTRSFVTIAIVVIMLLFLGFAFLVAAGGVGYMIYIQQENAEDAGDGGDEGLLLPTEGEETHWG